MLDDPSGWGELLTALAAFLVTHSVPARPFVRNRLIATLGRRAYLVGYSAVSAAILVWVVAAAASAPDLELWPREDWQPLVPAAGMVLASVLFVFAVTMPNPLSLGLQLKQPFNPERPGIAGLVRHPILWAMLIWSLTHIVPNGDVSHVLTFGLFAALSVGGMLMLDRRLRRTLGEKTWSDLARRTSNWPLLSLAKGWKPRFSLSTVQRFIAGIALYAVLVASHGWITGIPIVSAELAAAQRAPTPIRLVQVLSSPANGGPQVREVRIDRLVA